MNAGKVFLGMLAAMSAGAVLGVLFAPESGSALRRKISKTKDNYLQDMGQKFDDFIDGVSDQVTSVKDNASRMATNGKVKLEEAESKFNTAVR